MQNASFRQDFCILKVTYLENLIADMKTFWDYINKRLMKQIPNNSFWVELSFSPQILSIQGRCAVADPVTSQRVSRGVIKRVVVEVCASQID
jgi:hypothetical protein